MHSPIRSSKDWNNPDRLTIAHPAPEAVFMLEHSTTCKKDICPNPKCAQMKQMIEHSKHCSMPLESGCERCMQILSWTMWHSHFCTRQTCPVSKNLFLRN